MSPQAEKEIAQAIEVLTAHGWRWGDPALGENVKALMPGSAMWTADKTRS